MFKREICFPRLGRADDRTRFQMPRGPNLAPSRSGAAGDENNSYKIWLTPQLDNFSSFMGCQHKTEDFKLFETRE